MLELTGSLKELLKKTAERLKGHEHRWFMAKSVGILSNPHSASPSDRKIIKTKPLDRSSHILNKLRLLRTISRSPGWKTRAEVEGNDHDFNARERVTPYRIFLPELDELFYYFTTSKVTSDFIVDVIESWWLEHHKRFPQVKTLLN
jgi:hypothetical protein